MEFLCKKLYPRMGLAIADCGGRNPEESEVTCTCCQVCCKDDAKAAKKSLTVSDLGPDFVVLFGNGELPGCVQVYPLPWEL
mmetsp:Transcript_49916/g.150122  ORF Transcript_49916/g.150122 Transcript_49916/m.150122 type:complete len:81 (+) Transcript_49916:108-350(+)